MINVLTMNSNVTFHCQSYKKKPGLNTIYLMSLIFILYKHCIFELISKRNILYICFIYISCFMVFNATFNNISVISWRSVLLVEETEVPGENHRPV